MKQVTITIPDNKETIFIEMMKQVPFVKKIEAANNIVIPDWHKKEIDQSMESYQSSPEKYRDWIEVQEELNKKYGL